MKPMPLHNIAAPSPSVLSFLRAQVQHAFESPTMRCAAVTGQRRGLATTLTQSRCVDGKIRDGRRISTSISKLSDSRGFATTHRCPLELQTTRAQLALVPHNSSYSFTFGFQPRRGLSTTSINKNWWGRKGSQLPPPPPPPREPLGDPTLGVDGLERMSRSANELKMRCTELDEHGNVTMVSGEFKKSELIAKYGLLPRDLRKIDSSILPNILIRPTAILINLLHIRALIKHNRVLVFDAYGTTASQSQSVFMYDLDIKLRQKESPSTGTLAYEMRALEAVLISVTLGLEKELEGVSEPVVRVLMELEEDIDRDKLRYLLVYSKKLGTFEQKARLVRDALSELLEADDDLSSMYLSEKAQGKLRAEDDHTEVEMLLESYHKIADEIVQSAENLVSSIRNTEEIVKAILDANRNSLMLLELRFSVWTLSLTAGTFIAALYGMNLASGIEEHEWGFWGVSGVCGILAVGVWWGGIRRLRVVQRLTMWGHGGGGKSKWLSPWGLGGRGRRSSASRAGDRFVGAAGLAAGETMEAARAVRGLRAGENFGDLVKRERVVAKRLAQAEARMDQAAKGEL